MNSKYRTRLPGSQWEVFHFLTIECQSRHTVSLLLSFPSWQHPYLPGELWRWNESLTMWLHSSLPYYKCHVSINWTTGEGRGLEYDYDHLPEGPLLCPSVKEWVPARTRVCYTGMVPGSPNLFLRAGFILLPTIPGKENPTVSSSKNGFHRRHFQSRCHADFILSHIQSQGGHTRKGYGGGEVLGRILHSRCHQLFSPRDMGIM